MRSVYFFHLILFLSIISNAKIIEFKGMAIINNLFDNLIIFLKRFRTCHFQSILKNETFFLQKLFWQIFINILQYINKIFEIPIEDLTYILKPK